MLLDWLNSDGHTPRRCWKRKSRIGLSWNSIQRNFFPKKLVKVQHRIIVVGVVVMQPAEARAIGCGGVEFPWVDETILAEASSFPHALLCSPDMPSQWSSSYKGNPKFSKARSSRKLLSLPMTPGRVVAKAPSRSQSPQSWPLEKSPVPARGIVSKYFFRALSHTRHGGREYVHSAMCLPC